ncbi:MAG: cobalamin-binding protein, partial [Moorea sp. SIO4A3]|nr:cobalamin-binding protein [Moorena sp. SIO4A3]
VWKRYLSDHAYLEHFLEYRQIVHDQIPAQLAKFLAALANTRPLAEVARKV